MTPARKAALQWFHDRGEVVEFHLRPHPKASVDAPTIAMFQRMFRDGQVERRHKRYDVWDWYSLTDKGRRDLHEAGR